MQVLKTTETYKKYNHQEVKMQSNKRNSKPQEEKSKDIYLTISKEAREFWQNAEESNKTSQETSTEEADKANSQKPEKDENQKGMTDSFKEQLEELRRQAQESSEGAKKLIKCLKIAMEIATGNIVPSEDQEYLRKNNPELFAKAMEARLPNADPKECDSVLEDEDRENEEGQQNPKGPLYEFAGDITNISGNMSVSIS